MKKALPDQDKGHPFYSDEALRRWKKRIHELTQAEKEFGKTRRQPTEDIQETITRED